MELLKQLRASPDFQAVMKELVKHRPVIPYYTVQRTMDETNLLVEKIQAESCRQQGFDLLYQLLMGRNHGDVND